MQISASDLDNVNRGLLGIAPPLSYMSLDKTHCEQVKFQWKKLNRIDWCITSKGVPCPVAHCSTLTSEDTFEIPPPLPVEMECTKNNIKTDVEEPLINEELDIIYEQSKDETVDSQDSQITENTDADNSFMDNDNYDSDNPVLDMMCKVEDTSDGVDGSKNDEEYATMIAISLKEAKAAMEVYKMFSFGKFRCNICHKAYLNENRLKIHLRMHDKVGNFLF